MTPGRALSSVSTAAAKTICFLPDDSTPYHASCVPHAYPLSCIMHHAHFTIKRSRLHLCIPCEPFFIPPQWSCCSRVSFRCLFLALLPLLLPGSWAVCLIHAQYSLDPQHAPHGSSFPLLTHVGEALAVLGFWTIQCNHSKTTIC